MATSKIEITFINGIVRIVTILIDYETPPLDLFKSVRVI